MSLQDDVTEMVEAGMSDEQIQAYITANTPGPGPSEFAPQGHDFNAMNMIKNVPSSGAQYVENMATAIASPVETAKAIGNLFLGAVQKLYPGEQEAEKYADAFANAMKERYGSWDNAKRTLENDPVGLLGDVSSFLIPAGAMGKLASANSMVRKAGDITSKVGAAIDPLNIVANPVISGGAKMVPQSRIANLYEHGLQFGPSVPLQKRAPIIRTALDEAIEPTLKGLNKIDLITDSVNSQIDNLIKAASSGEKVPRAALYSNLQELRNKYGGVNISGGKNLDDITEVARNFDLHMEDIGKKYLTAEDLQKFKKDLYQEVRYDQSANTARRVADETKKAMGRSARENIERIVPETRDLNAREGRLLSLKDAIEGPAAKAKDAPVLPLNFQLKMLLGGVIGGGPGAGVGFLAGMLDKAKNRGKLAIAVHKIKNQGLFDNVVNNSSTNALVRQALEQSGDFQDEIKKQKNGLFD